MNAWFWRVVMAGNGLFALLWWGYWRDRSMALAMGGVALAACGMGLQLGLQMLLMRWVLGRQGLPAPGVGVLWRAWLAEWRAASAAFGWRMPFREHAQPDALDEASLGASPKGQVGVVLVHGYFCNRAAWNDWLRALRQRGIPCAAMTLEPAHGSPVDAMVADLDRCARAMAQATGRAPLLVAHSMGGLVVRAWLKTLTAQERALYAAHVMTVATPHQGTWMGRFTYSLPARDMREGSDWLAQLGLPPPDVPFTCWCSSCDNLVFPPSLAQLPGARVHQLDDVAHMQMLSDARIWQGCLQLREALQLSE